MNPSVKQYQKSEKKWKNELKALKKKNNMLFDMSKKLVSRCELKTIKNIPAKEPKKYGSSGSNSSSSNYDYPSPLVTESETK